MPDSIKAIIERRISEDSVADDVAHLVRAALEDHLAEALAGESVNRANGAVEEDGGENPAGAWLTGIAVQGFRGIGPRADLPVSPGPGLTLVLGRNGTGKSSFAEGLEIALTGTNSRWEDKAKEWEDGWSNLHYEGPPAIEARFSVPGVVTEKRVSLRWQEEEAALADFVREGFDELGWEDAVTSHRPLLSHSQLSRRLEGRAVDLFRAVATGLGFEQVSEAHERIRKQKRDDDNARKEAREALEEILPDLHDLDDDRARTCLEALSADPWEVGVVEAALKGAGDEGGERSIDTLNGLLALDAPTPESIGGVCSQLVEASEQLTAIAGSDAARAERLLRALNEALTIHEHDGDQRCPVCGHGTIDSVWASEARTRAEALRREATEVSDAHKARGRALKAARQLCPAPPTTLEQAETVGVDASAAAAAWREWAEAPDDEIELPELVERLRTRGAALQAAIEALQETARAELRHRHSLWQPVRERLEVWLPLGRAALEVDARRQPLNAAEKWLGKARDDVRAERFRPVSERSQRFWEMMRQNSSVSLDGIGLRGTGNRQRLDLAVSVDGAESAALGVMSQGELNTLSLSLFLARATLDDSPFRFLVVDDPVQAMDPAKVDGLATVLAEVARTRQVVVFTHDTRLRHSVRQMRIDADIFELTRSVNSEVVCKKDDGPVRRNLDDARAILTTDDVFPETKAKVIPMFCRSALEAACVEAIWRQRTMQGVGLEETERDINKALTLFQKVALLLQTDGAGDDDVLEAIEAAFGSRAREVAVDCNSGSHGGSLLMEPRTLINATRSFTDKVKKQFG